MSYVELKTGVPITPKNPRTGTSDALRRMTPGDYCSVPMKSDNVRTLITAMRKAGHIQYRYTLRKQGEKVTGIWCLTPSE